MSADTDRLVETVRNGLIKGSRDSQLLDGREYDAAYWADADAALDGLVLEHTRQEAVVEAARMMFEVGDPEGVYDDDLLRIALHALSPPPVASPRATTLERISESAFVFLIEYEALHPERTLNGQEALREELESLVPGSFPPPVASGENGCPNVPDDEGNWPCERGPKDECLTCGWQP